ncbi:Sbal_3080 family lipoprotein [Vagococcus sp. WN89Y]|uniref:Sbal_3080 family lipoprotein n=1 Tax=Vagococcus sp. WN89Y TaxID=3457258 RepID=UPI003FCC3FF2
MKIKALLPVFAVGLVGCTSVKVAPLPKTEAINRICIQKNDAVKVSDLLPVVQQRLKYHNIESVVFTDTRPENCPWIMNYTARRTWDVVPYLSFAEFTVNRDGVQVASAHFHLRAGGGLSLMKWRGTAYKINPVIDRLVGSGG